MESDKVVISRKFQIAKQVRHDLVILAIGCAVIGTLVFDGGYVLSFLTAASGRIPAEIASVASFFVGIAIDLGILVALFGLIVEAKSRLVIRPITIPVQHVRTLYSH